MLASRLSEATEPDMLISYVSINAISHNAVSREIGRVNIALKFPVL